MSVGSTIIVIIVIILILVICVISVLIVISVNIISTLIKCMLTAARSSSGSISSNSYLKRCSGGKNDFLLFFDLDGLSDSSLSCSSRSSSASLSISS